MSAFEQASTAIYSFLTDPDMIFGYWYGAGVVVFYIACHAAAAIIGRVKGIAP